MAIRNASNSGMSYKRELQYETLILGEQNILPLPAEQPSQIPLDVLSEAAFPRDLPLLALLLDPERFTLPWNPFPGISCPYCQFQLLLSHLP